MTRIVAFITDFGDAGLVVPVCVAVLLTLLLLGVRRAAAVWAAVTAGVWSTMLLLKLGGYAVEGIAGPSGLITPSGHAAAAAAAYGGLVALSTGSRRWAVGTALAVATLIGTTRVALGDHTTEEVLVGGVVGTIGAGLLAAWLPSPLTRRRRWAVLGVVVAVLLVLHGAHMTWERQIRATSGYAVRELL